MTQRISTAKLVQWGIASSNVYRLFVRDLVQRILYSANMQTPYKKSDDDVFKLKLGLCSGSKALKL